MLRSISILICTIFTTASLFTVATGDTYATQAKPTIENATIATYISNNSNPFAEKLKKKNPLENIVDSVWWNNLPQRSIKDVLLELQHPEKITPKHITRKEMKALINRIDTEWDDKSKKALFYFLAQIDLPNYLDHIVNGRRDDTALKLSSSVHISAQYLLDIIEDPSKTVIASEQLSRIITSGALKKQHISLAWKKNTANFIKLLLSEELTDRFILISTLVSRGYISYDSFLLHSCDDPIAVANAATYFQSEKNYYAKDNFIIPSAIIEFLNVLYPNIEDTSNTTAYKSIVGLLIKGQIGKINGHEMPRFQNSIFDESLTALNILIKNIGIDNTQFLWENNPQQCITILAFINNNYKTGESLDTMFEWIGNTHIKSLLDTSPTHFIKETLAQLKNRKISKDITPMGLEVEVRAYDIHKAYGYLGLPLARQMDNDYKKLIILAMFLGSYPTSESGYIFEFITPLFYNSIDASEYIDKFVKLKMISYSPLHVNMVLSVNTPANKLYQFQFVKHILYTPIIRFQEFHDNAYDYSSSIRIKRDFEENIETLDQDLKRFEDRMNTFINDSNEWSYPDLFRYHHNMWVAYARSNSDNNIAEILLQHEHRLDEWFENLLQKNIKIPSVSSNGIIKVPIKIWVKRWCTEAGVKNYASMSLTEKRQALFSLDIGLPYNKERFIVLKQSLPEETIRELEMIVTRTLELIDNDQLPDRLAYQSA